MTPTPLPPSERVMDKLTERSREATKPKFGDCFLNPYASERNPERIGYFIRAGKRTGKLNPGAFYELTDKNGRFWEMQPKDLIPQVSDPAASLLAECRQAIEDARLYFANSTRWAVWADALLTRLREAGE